jgi:hypothetical protein
LQEILGAFEKNLMFDRKEGKVYSYDELDDASAALIAQRHAELRDAGKEIGKLLSGSNRVLKVCCLADCVEPVCTNMSACGCSFGLDGFRQSHTCVYTVGHGMLGDHSFFGGSQRWCFRRPFTSAVSF